jgi:ABC-type multidrug transport system ATPase subunit
MVGLASPSSGRVLLYGRDIARQRDAVPLLVGYMPQDGRALNNLTVGEALYFTAHLRGLGRADARAERDRLLALWQISPLRDSYTPRLSGGQKRLLQLAVAMAARPPVLILDEPTNDLDPKRRALVWGVLREASRAEGTTIIFITHDAIEAEKIIQRVGIMHEGRLIAVGSPADLKRQLAHPLRLELAFDPAEPPALPPGVELRELEPGRWLVLGDRTAIGAALPLLDLARLHDLRLTTATLEDLYMHYAANT